MASPVWADQPLSVVYPPADHQTTAERIFLIGTAPSAGDVLVNGKPIERSPAGHFAPSFPLKLGDNIFTLHYQNQQVQIKVKRVATVPESPMGLAFGKDSLTPSVDIAKLPGELICFGAIAPPNATVSVQLGNQTVPLLPQSQQVNLPANSAALTGQNQPASQAAAGQFQGCTTMPAGFGSLIYGNNIITGAVSGSNTVQPKFQLTANGKTITQIGAGKIAILSPAKLEVAEVTADSGVARTGPSTDYSRLTPLPKGTQANVTGREGEWLRLDYGGWINSKETRILPNAVPPRSLIRSISTHQISGATEVVFPLQVPVPVSVQQGDRTLTLTLYNTTAQTDVIRLNDEPVISRLDWQQVAPEQVQYTFNLKSQQQWGYKLRYDGTTLVLSLRHPPGVRGQGSGVRGQGLKDRDPSPLSGIKILLDPGHGGAELGAKGPTGYPEKDINLVISKLVREQLIARGATVYMTREEDKEVSLPERVAMIDKLEPAIALSLHYNALPDGGDAMNTKGFAAFWYHPQAHSLAMFLHNYVVNKLDRPSYGVFWNNLALTRPATAPSVLLELGFMINPTEFEWIVNPQEQKKLAEAIADGITEWFSSAR
ncbi:N-acetylmuramoyl-L-alanine amidase [Chroococcidiopsis sp. CCMEE 29]|uniref:N-acetylmuramoyl-L-alanine amidase n=1 Tax=Chroococcidiopsis sp. CCMEE 29 TaxID=155894 RepID=UPI0020222843|nr:N-acetylmuramoyl-L-alanine amidase [Chroococcidiopsis sp. CCMEE 29]